MKEDDEELSEAAIALNPGLVVVDIVVVQGRERSDAFSQVLQLLSACQFGYVLSSSQPKPDFRCG